MGLSTILFVAVMVLVSNGSEVSNSTETRVAEILSKMAAVEISSVKLLHGNTYLQGDPLI